MSVVRGRPPGLAGGIRGASRAYCSSLSACPAPKSPTKARFSAVHMACLQEGLLPSLNRRHGHSASSSVSTARASQTASKPRPTTQWQSDQLLNQEPTLPDKEVQPVLRLFPKLVTATPTTAAIRAISMPYSTRPAPSSSRLKRLQISRVLTVSFASMTKISHRERLLRTVLTL